MGILSWIIFGLVAGLLARAIMPGKDPSGCVITTLLGIAGAIVGGFIGTLLRAWDHKRLQYSQLLLSDPRLGTAALDTPFVEAITGR